MACPWIPAVCLLICADAGFANAPGDVLRTQATAPEGRVLEQAEALDEAAVRAIVDRAYASIGCALPSDLVTVFEVYLLDQAMLSLGVRVGADVARDGVFALRLRSTTIRHAQARAVLSVARALQGRVAADIDDGRLQIRQGLFEVRDCVPGGTLFALSPYAGD